MVPDKFPIMQDNCWPAPDSKISIDSERPSYLPLLGLPQEILEQIYVHSENPSLPQTSRQLYQALSSRFIRLQFCSHIFSKDFKSSQDFADPRFQADSYYGKDLVRLQTFLLQRTWFDASFAQRLEEITPTLRSRALLWERGGGKARHSLNEAALKRSPSASFTCAWFLENDWLPVYCEWTTRYYIRKSASSPLYCGEWHSCPNIKFYHQSDKDGNFQSPTRRRTGDDIDVHIPARWLMGRWTDDRVEMFYRLQSWFIEPKLTKETIRRVLVPAWHGALADKKDDIADQIL